MTVPCPFRNASAFLLPGEKIVRVNLDETQLARDYPATATRSYFYEGTYRMMGMINLQTCNYYVNVKSKLLLLQQSN